MQIFNVNIRQKGHFLLFLTHFWTYLAVKYKPFNDLSLNRIDNFSNVCSSVVLFCGCLYLFEVNNFVKPLLYLLILIINILFLMVFAKTCVSIILSLLKNKRISKFRFEVSMFLLRMKKSIAQTRFDLRIPRKFRAKAKFVKGLVPFPLRS